MAEQRAPVLTVKQVADEFAVRVKTVYGWIDDKHLHAIKLPGGDYRVRREDIAEFEERCRDRSSKNQPTDSSGEEQSGPSPGPTPTLVALGPFQRGQQSATRRKSGETNG